MKVIVCIIISIFIITYYASLADCLEVKLISPIGAVARSTIPGWGQFYTHDKLQGVIVFLSVGIMSGVGAYAYMEYQDYYSKYRPAALSGSSQANFYYEKANDFNKLSQFLFYTAAGIWAYGAIDSYIDAHIYNARIQASMIDVDSTRFNSLK